MDAFDKAADSYFEQLRIIRTNEEERKHLAAHFRERCKPGTCGECEWWCSTTHTLIRKCTVWKPGFAAFTTVADCSCPRFKRRPSKAERVARELLDLSRGTGVYADAVAPTVAVLNRHVAAWKEDGDEE